MGEREEVSTTYRNTSMVPNLAKTKVTLNPPARMPISENPTTSIT